jgi:hypothetical protein
MYKGKPFVAMLSETGILATRPDLYGGDLLTFNPWAACIVAMLTALVVAWVIGGPVLKLKGHYLAMATLGFGTIVYRIALGTTLLGADNKAGVAEIVAAAEYLMKHPKIKHGKVRAALAMKGRAFREVVPDWDSIETMRTAARAIHLETIKLRGSSGKPLAVVIKGGHLSGNPIDVFFNGRKFYDFEGDRYVTPHTHGTGCTLSAAIATELAKGRPVLEAVERAKAFVTSAIVCKLKDPSAADLGNEEIIPSFILTTEV